MSFSPIHVCLLDCNHAGIDCLGEHVKPRSVLIWGKYRSRQIYCSKCYFSYRFPCQFFAKFSSSSCTKLCRIQVIENGIIYPIRVADSHTDVLFDSGPSCPKCDKGCRIIQQELEDNFPDGISLIIIVLRGGRPLYS